MPPTYGKAECSICYIRLPKPEMVQHYSFQYEPGRTRTYFRDSSSFGSREIGRSVEEDRWSVRNFWVCASCEPVYQERRRAVYRAIAVVCLCLVIAVAFAIRLSL